MAIDHNGNQRYKRAVLSDRGTDLTKEWYLEYYAYDEDTDGLLRRRIKNLSAVLSEKFRIPE